MSAPSPLLLFALSSVALASYYAAPDEIQTMRERFTDEYRRDATELKWTIGSLPREVQSAGEEIRSLWHRGSTVAMAELRHLRDELKSDLNSR